MTRPIQLTTRVRRCFPYRPALFLSGDGRSLLCWDDRGVRAFDAAQAGEARWEESAPLVACAGRGTWVALAIREPSNRIEIRSAWEGSLVATLPLPVAPVKLACGGTDRLLCLDSAGTLHRLDLEPTGAIQSHSKSAIITDPFDSSALAASEDGGSALVAACKRDARSCPVLRVDLVKMTVTHTLKGPRAEVKAVRIAPDGSTLVAATAGALIAWAGPKGKARTLFKAKHFVHLAGFVDSRYLVVADPQETCQCIDLQSDTVVWQHPHYGPTIVERGQVLHGRFEEVYLREGKTGALLARADVPRFPNHLVLDLPRNLAHIGGSAGNLLRTWRLDQPEIEPSAEENGDQISVYVVSGPRLVLGTKEGTLLVHDLHTTGTPRVIPPPPRTSSTDDCDALFLDLDRNQLWAGIGERLTRFQFSTGAVEAQSDQLKDDLVAILPLPEAGVVIAAARARRRSYGALCVLDFHTLAAQSEHRLSSTPDAIERGKKGEILLRGPGGVQRFDLRTHEMSWVQQIPWRPHPKLALSPCTPYGVEQCTRRDQAAERWIYALRLWKLDPGGGDPTPVAGEIEGSWTTSPPQWSADGAVYYSLHEDRRLCRWDGSTGAFLAEVSVTVSRPGQLFLLPDGQRALVTGNDGACELWRLDW